MAFWQVGKRKTLAFSGLLVWAELHCFSQQRVQDAYKFLIWRTPNLYMVCVQPDG